MVKYIQSYCKSLADYGCYLFCLFDIAEKVTGKNFDVIKKSWYFITKGWIKFNQNNYKDADNFYILNPVAILNHLTGKRWTIKKEDSFYNPDYDKDFVVEFWSIDGKTGHFARTLQGDFNSLEHSRNVEQGRCRSFRIFNIVG